jgi:YegS/Rv2252/BmrU family lipid kinase
MRTKIIINSNANPGAIKRYFKEACNILTEKGLQLSVDVTKLPGDATLFARNAATKRYELIIAVGGDGTINEVVNGIVGKNIPLAILPNGGSNVLALELGIPLNIVDAAKRIDFRLKRKIDLGLIRDRYFIVMASCGYDAYAISKIDMKIKKILRRYAYILAGLKDLFGYHPRNIQLNMDNGKFVEEGTFVVISNAHFYAGPYQVTPYAKIDDGYLDLCIYQGKSQLGLIHFVFRVFWKQHLTLKNVKYFRVKQVELSSEKRVLVQVDGDLLGQLPVKVEIFPKALDIIC